MNHKLQRATEVYTLMIEAIPHDLAMKLVLAELDEETLQVVEAVVLRCRKVRDQTEWTHGTRPPAPVRSLNGAVPSALRQTMGQL